jgi:hypothetical protein
MRKAEAEQSGTDRCKRAGVEAGPVNSSAGWPQAEVFIGMHIIIMPPHIIIIGMPICIMFIMVSQHFMNMSFMEASIGIISQVMPLAVIVHFIWQPMAIGMPIIGIPVICMPGIGIMPPDIIGFIMPGIIIGIGIICIAAFIFPTPAWKPRNETTALFLLCR